MKTIYRIKGYIAFAEKDNWENGCDMNTTTIESDEYFELSSSTLSGLLEEVKAYFKVEDYDLLLDSCDKLGRLDVQTYSREPFMIQNLSEKSKERWKAGEIDVWLNYYSMQVEAITSEFSLSEVLTPV